MMIQKEKKKKKKDKDHKKVMADWINLLHGSVNAASYSPQRICIVTDTSTPSLPLQSVVVFHLWPEGTSTTTSLQLVLLHLTTLNCKQSRMASVIVGLEDVCQVHVFSNSA
jgi:hypothetical protein